MFDEKITPYQNLSILIIISFVFQTMLMPIVLSEVEGPMGWVTIVLGALLLFITIKPLNEAMKNYKEDTIIGITNKIFPKYISKIIGLYYIFMFIIANSILMKDFSEQIKLLMLFKTPISVIIMIILLVASYASKKGMQTIAQIAQITIITSFIPYILLMIFSIYYSDYTNVFPMFPMDVKGIIKTVPNALFGFFGYSLIMFSNSHVKDKKDNMRLNKTFILISAALYIGCYILIVIKFGMEEAVKMVWPFLSIMKFVNIPGFFFESTEILGLMFQIGIIFTCICILMYFTNFVMKETFETEEYGYFNYIQIPILYIMSSALPGMYMLYPYIKIPAYIFSGINLIIPLIIIIKNKKQKYQLKN